MKTSKLILMFSVYSIHIFPPVPIRVIHHLSFFLSFCPLNLFIFFSLTTFASSFLNFSFFYLFISFISSILFIFTQQTCAAFVFLFLPYSVFHPRPCHYIFILCSPFALFLFFSSRKSARKRGSIFELLLSEALEDMILLHSKKGPKSLRKNKKWDETYKNSLSNNYYKKRTEKYILMNPKKRKILFKLLAMKNLLKDHKRDSIYRKDSENGEEHSGDNSSQWGTGTDEGEGDGE